MKKLHALKISVMFMAGIITLAAQNSGWQLNGALALPFGSANDKMGLTLGAHAGLAYTIQTSSGYAVRPGLSLGYYSGKGVTGVQADADFQINNAANPGQLPNSDWQAVGSSVKHTLTQIEIINDVLIPVATKWNMVLGISLSKYQGKFSGGAAGHYDPGEGLFVGGIYSPVGIDKAHYEPDGSAGLNRSGDPNGSFSIPGYKFGLRVGFEYTYNKNFTSQVLYHQTELGRMVSKTSALPTVNPSSLEFGIIYHF